MPQYVKTIEDVVQYQKYIEEKLTLNNSLLYLTIEEGFQKWLKNLPYRRRLVYKLRFRILYFEPKSRQLRIKTITVDEFGKVLSPFKLPEKIPQRFIENDPKYRRTPKLNKKKRKPTRKKKRSKKRVQS